MSRITLLAVLGGMTIALSACSGQDESARFESELRNASEHAEASVGDALAPLAPIALDASPQASLLAEPLSEAAAALEEYADAVAHLSPPSDFQNDRDRHVEALRTLAAQFEHIVVAARASDQARVSELFAEATSTIRNVAAALSPGYVAIAYIAPDFFGGDIFVGTSAEEGEYLDGVEGAMREFESRNEQFGAALSRQYAGTAALLAALAEAGAGTAFAAVYDAARELDPPSALRGDHELWLESLEEKVEIDRQIGEAARDGDMARFEVLNHRLRLVDSDVVPKLSPKLVAVIASPDVALTASATLDGKAPISATDYGHDLFDALKAFRLRFDPDGIYFFFEQSGAEVILDVVPQLASDTRRLVDEGRASLNELTPAEPYEAEHARILEYFEELVANQERILAAAERRDIDAVREEIDRTTELYCAAAAELSDDIAPATNVYFGDVTGRPPLC